MAVDNLVTHRCSVCPFKDICFPKSGYDILFKQGRVFGNHKLFCMEWTKVSVHNYAVCHGNYSVSVETTLLDADKFGIVIASYLIDSVIIMILPSLTLRQHFMPSDHSI